MMFDNLYIKLAASSSVKTWIQAQAKTQTKAIPGVMTMTLGVSFIPWVTGAWYSVGHVLCRPLQINLQIL